MKLYISPSIADLLLAPGARGDIEGALLAGLLNIAIIGLGFLAYKNIKQSVKFKLFLSKVKYRFYFIRKERI